MIELVWRLKHQIFDSLRIVGLRDRLRCPRCSSVGTYKPHGGWFDSERRKFRRRRWMCKWCGYYDGPEPNSMVVINTEKGYWDFIRNAPDGKTPYEIIRGTKGYETVWPWFG